MYKGKILKEYTYETFLNLLSNTIRIILLVLSYFI